MTAKTIGMRLSTLAVAIGLSLVGLVALRADAPRDDAPGESVTLLGTLAEWQYPDIKMPQGATMSDGGFAGIVSMKCQTVMTTPDSVEKVIAFYAKKFGVSPDPDARLAAANDVQEADAKSVAVQDDSKERPMTLRVFVVNKATTSTTLVISRAADEKETHIAWTHFSRFDVKR